MLTRSVCTALVVAVFASGPASAQQPPAADPGVEVLARGPVHEAFAATAELPIAGPVVPKLPPQPVDELPPDQKPAGENVTWIPGYWNWDEERTDFIWISGFWRVPPPGRVWVPGSWREVQGGWQWVQGFWQEAAPTGPVRAAVATDIQYLPPPPQPLEVAPSVPAPSAASFYVPGTWVWRHRYVWRPGFWIDYRPGWVWTAAHYRYTPAGYVFVDGYWDHPLETRGVLFAPVAFAPVVIARPAFVYTPVYCVPPASLYTSLFVRRGWGGYYFGDYFEPRYSTIGFSAWIGGRSGGFAVSVGVGRAAPAYDPLWAYYQTAHRHDPAWAVGITNVYAGRYHGDLPRPPRTLVQQNVVVNNITNVTNNTTVIKNTVNNTVINKPTTNTAVNNLTMVTPITNIPKTNPAVALRPVQRAERVQEQQTARQLNEVAANRQKLETGLASRSLTPTQPTDKPRQVKLDVPQTFVARAQVPTAPDRAPPPPAAKLAELGTNTAGRTPPAAKGVNSTPPPVVPPARETTRSVPTTTRPTQPLMPPPATKPSTLPTLAPPTAPVQPAVKPQTLPPATKPTTLPPPVTPGTSVKPATVPGTPTKPAGPMPPQMGGLPTLPPPRTPATLPPAKPTTLPPARPVGQPAPIGRPMMPPAKAPPPATKPADRKSDDKKGPGH